MEFGHIVKRLREAKVLTQMELALLLGCHLSMVQHIERGRRRPSPVMARRIAELIVPKSKQRCFLFLAISGGAALEQLRKRAPEDVVKTVEDGLRACEKRF